VGFREAMLNADKGKDRTIQVHQPPRSQCKQVAMELIGALNSLYQVRLVWKQMVFTSKTLTWKVNKFLVRTQTKIKNYFYGTIRYFLKIIIKYFCKKSTGFVNDIKT